MHRFWNIKRACTSSGRRPLARPEYQTVAAAFGHHHILKYLHAAPGHGLQVQVPCNIARMKKGKFGNRTSPPRGGAAPKTVEQYLDRVPEPARRTLIKMRATIRSAAPPKATEIISYGIPAFKHKEVLVWYAAFSKHCSLFPTASVIEEFKNELKGFSISKGTIQFTTDSPLPIPLVKKLVKARLAKSENKKRR